MKHRWRKKSVTTLLVYLGLVIATVNASAYGVEAKSSDIAIYTPNMRESEEILDELSEVMPVLEPEASNETLFANYVDMMFEAQMFSATPIADKGLGNRYLRGESLAVYNQLKQTFESVANGSLASVRNITVDLSDYNIVYDSAALEKLGISGIKSEEDYKIVFQDFVQRVELKRVMTYLLRDCPYDLYWYDKTQGMSYNYEYDRTKDGGIRMNKMHFRFCVCKDYATTDSYTLNTEKISATRIAVENAQKIVAAASSYSDVEKLRYFKEQICEMTDYNREVVSAPHVFGDPWQMIYVFDGDPSTKVVCEGYSKAFQYLCDKTVFKDNIDCVIVSGLCGVVDSAKASGAHMWNHVRMPNGKVYLADITNSDQGNIGVGGELFLAGASLTSGNYQVNCGRSKIAYTYDDSTKTNLSDYYLKLSDLAYDVTPNCNHVNISTTGKIDATCTESGMSGDIKCLDCGAYLQESLYVKAKGHLYVDGKEGALDKYKVSDATCTKKAVYNKHCSACGKISDATFEYGEFDLTKHDFSEQVYLTSEPGKHYQKCKNCQRESEHLTCSPSKEVTENSIIPTCGKEGSYDQVVYCTKCEQVLRRTSVTVPATGEHIAETTVTKASLTKDGKRETKCLECGKFIKSNIIYAVKNVKLSAIYYTYDGKAKTPKVTVTDSKGNTIAASNYTVTYSSDRKNVGKHTVKVTLKGDYSGSKSLTFKVYPPKTKISSVKAGAKAFTVKWAKKSSQVSGYEIQYATSSDFESGAKTMKVTSAKTISKNVKGLKAKTKYYVRIRTFKSIGSTKYYSEWSEKKSVVTKK
ncbi:MAG: fibronectin type III domain-containing protein [Eubacteriales bacterium]|nr:fibronectin type III domain-containing protein [Eubacteriales bacterium]